MTTNFILDQLIMTGFDHKHTPLEFREQVSFTLGNIENAYKKIKDDAVLSETVILSTCNRSEIYTIAHNPAEAELYLKQFYVDFFNLSLEHVDQYIVFRTKKAAVKHLFEVSCGFQSLVLCEDQILGQVKDSYKTAIKYDTAGKIMSRLFIDSITTAKHIRTLTGMTDNALSVSSIGVKLIERKLTNLSDKAALVIGLGEMSRITIQNLLDKEIKKVFVTNRTRRRIRDFAKQFPDIVEIEFKSRYEIISEVDIIVSCTAAPHTVIRKEKFAKYYNNKALCILDLAIPRDIDPGIESFRCIELYRIDDLEKIARENIEKRLQAKQQGLEIIDADVKKYINWIKELKTGDLILILQDYSKKITEKELAKLRKKLSNIDDKEMLLIEKSFESLSRSFIHQPMVKIKEFCKENEEYRKIISDIFTLEDEFCK